MNYSQADFGKILDVGGNYIYMLESGTKPVSDRIVKDICREFDVNEMWLRTGKGEMFVQKSMEEEIAAFAKQVINYGSESFRARFISALSKLDEKGWAVLEKLAADMSAENKKDQD